MSASERTSNYELPVYKPNDILSVLTDFNECIRKLDDALSNISKKADNVDSKAEINKNSIENVNVEVSNLKSGLSELSGLVNNINSSLTLLQTHTNEQDLELEGLKDYNNTQDNKILSLKNEKDENIRDLENEDSQINNKITHVQSEMTRELSDIDGVLTELKNNFDNVITFYDVDATAINFNIGLGTEINVVVDSISIGDKTKIEIYLDFIVSSTHADNIKIRLENSIFSNLGRKMNGYFYTHGTGENLESLAVSASDLKPVLFRGSEGVADIYMAVPTEIPVEVKAYLTGTFSNFS